MEQDRWPESTLQLEPADGPQWAQDLVLALAKRGECSNPRLRGPITADELAVEVRQLSTLSDRARRLIELRFGVNGNNGKRTLDELGAFLGVSRERVRQREAQALTWLRGSESRRASMQQAERAREASMWNAERQRAALLRRQKVRSLLASLGLHDVKVTGATDLTVKRLEELDELVKP